MLSNIPPTISENQCTPERSLNRTITIINTVIDKTIRLLNHLDLIRHLNCIIAVDITVKTNNVVDEGYEISNCSLISTGL